MIDFHTHILPGIDDGSSSVEESVRMIQMLSEQGVKKILLTPHFYAYMSSTDSFVQERKSSLKKLVKALEGTNLDVELYLGSEVLFFEELWRVSKIKDLCITGTNFILLEMPFSSWQNSMVECVIKLSGRGVTPVIAHFERYLKYKGNASKIRELMNNGVLLQMNCGCLNKFFSRSKAIKYIKKGEVFALGTDCHDISERKPNYDCAISFLKKKLSDRQFLRFNAIQEDFMRKAKKVYPEE